MTITESSFPARGASNPMTRPTEGIEALILDLQAQISALSLSGITSDSLFSAEVQSSAVNVTKTSQPNVLKFTMTASSKYVRLGDCTAQDTLYDGGIYWVWNAGSTYSFDVQDNGGTVLVSALAPGEVVGLMCVSDATAAGEWKVYGRIDNAFIASSTSASVDTTLTSQPNVLKFTMTASGKYVRLGSCTDQPSLFDGGVYWIHNAGSTYSFDVQDNDGTVLVSALAPGETIGLMCVDDTTAAGEWKIIGRNPSVRVVEKTASYTLDITANNVMYRLNHATTAIVVTVPPESSVAFPVGTQVGLMQIGAAACSIVAGSGVTIRQPTWAGLTILDQYTSAYLTKIGADEWLLEGNV